MNSFEEAKQSVAKEMEEYSSSKRWNGHRWDDEVLREEGRWRWRGWGWRRPLREDI